MKPLKKNRLRGLIDLGLNAGLQIRVLWSDPDPVFMIRFVPDPELAFKMRSDPDPVFKNWSDTDLV